MACKASVAFRMSSILCPLDAFHMRPEGEYDGTQRRWLYSCLHSDVYFMFSLTSATHSSSAHRVCLSSEIDCLPRWRRRRRRQTSLPSYKNWKTISSARLQDDSAKRAAYRSEGRRGRRHTEKTRQLESVLRVRITTPVIQTASEDAARRTHVIRTLSALKATPLQSRARDIHHRNLFRARPAIRSPIS